MSYENEENKIVPDAQQENPVHPKKRIIRRRRVARKAAVTEPMPARKEPTFEDQLDGMSPRQPCPTACYKTPGKCIFTDENACGSPINGALQSRFMSNPEILGRRLRAEAWLAHQKVDRRSGK